MKRGQLTGGGEYRPVVIIGAPRSGTNMLRDALSRVPGIATWPCDEINYIWRYGNRDAPTDEFHPDLATAPVRRFIRRAFDRLATSKTGTRFVLEKTCANSLRVAFVDRVLPDAKYIFIVRDGRDVVASALKRWTAPLDLPYVLRKARYIPLGDVPYYGARYLRNRIYRLLSGDRRLAVWGPQFADMDVIAAQGSLAELCAVQWARCVERAQQDLEQLDLSRVHRVRYEDFVRDPVAGISGIGQFLGIDRHADDWRKYVADVSRSSVGKGTTDLDDTQLATISPLLEDTLKSQGYEP